MMTHGPIPCAVFAIALTMLVTAAGCRGAEPELPSQIEKTTEGESPAPAASVPATDDAHSAVSPDDVGPTAAEGAADTATAERTTAPPGVPDEAVAARSRDALERAYVAIYCAQRRGETARLQAIYAAHGFSDPREWRRTWNEATRDREWLAAITRKAIETCP